MDSKNSTNVLTEVTTLIREWEDTHNQPNYNPLPILVKLAEKIELETENYLKMDPDPFDERHPSRTDPECKLGQILKILFRKDNFMTKLVNDYLRDTYYSRLGITGRDVNELNVAACRLMLDIMPGLETSVVFQPDMDGLIQRLIRWATDYAEPLQSYATGLLAAAMEIPEIATRYREQNGRLVPLMLKRLRLCQESCESFNANVPTTRPFAHLSGTNSPPHISNCNNDKKFKRENPTKDDVACEREKKRIKLDNDVSSSSTVVRSGLHSETSNSSWAELESYVIGSIQLYPLTVATKQILILRYLTPMGEYQEFLSHVFEHNALELILNNINVKETKEARLAFEALKYLAALLCHKKFSIEFIQSRCLEYLLEVPRPSITATGVSICLYYLGYCEEAMERVCLLPKHTVNNLVSYALWLLECSHDSGRCHATMFFGLTFQFRVILEEFDLQDGLRKLHNVISTLPILSSEDSMPLNEDAECAARQIVRHVCVAYKRYLEAHLHIKVEQLRRYQLKSHDRSSSSLIPSLPSYKACKSSPEEVQQQVETLLQTMPFRTHWQPVDQLLKLGGITLLLKIIAFAYEWNYSGRAETVRCALDVLAIACVIPKVVSLFCDRVDLPEDTVTVGINIILGAADGEIVADADVQKAALRVIMNCVCAPIHRVNTSKQSLVGTASPSKKMKSKNSEELIQKVWESVRSNSGIMVLLQLMNVKTPITDADCIRTLACKALAGLARSDTVRQIVSKLPLLTSGQLQTLMRDPILQEKRQEHVSFQKYALELLERLSGKTKHKGNDLETSLGNIHKANIVAQTKIHFNDRQLLQLIHQHLASKGFAETTKALQKEANISNALVLNNIHPPNKFRYTSTSTPNRVRTTFSSPLLKSSNFIDANDSLNFNAVTSNTIKIKKKSLPALQNLNFIQKPRLQKQLSAEPHVKIVLPNQTNEDAFPANEPPRITLDSIITEYLTNQHALCKNPMATCPQFNLFVPHKCPDPKPKIQAANNFAIRSSRRQIGFYSKVLDRKFIHSRFCPVQTIRLPNEEGFFTCVAFLTGDQSVMVGTYSGDIRTFNIHTGNEESVFSIHDAFVNYLEPNKDGTLLLSCSSWGRPLSALWSLNGCELKYSFYDEYLEFSKVTQDRIIGTKTQVAAIYDVNTGTLISELIPTVSNNYTRNKATFSYNDDLVLSDGVLFDVNSGRQIHKLDKLNQTQSGVFHPNGLEIISNTEVWDIRTFQLLKTVPVLNLCQLIFAPVNNIIYSISLEHDVDEDPTFDTSFKTIDSTDYSSIATFDLKRNINDLAVNRFDNQIAIVENQGIYHSSQESVVRLYDVGRKRDDEDEQEEEDDEEEEDDLDGSDDEGSENGTVSTEALGDTVNNDNNENNDIDDEDVDDDNFSDGSWIDVLDETDDSNDNYSSDSSNFNYY